MKGYETSITMLASWLLTTAAILNFMGATRLDVHFSIYAIEFYIFAELTPLLRRTLRRRIAMVGIALLILFAGIVAQNAILALIG